MSEAAAPLRERLLHDLLANRHNAAILDRWQRLALPDGWLVAGCLFQTVWNLQHGQPPAARIKDYDLFYFDPDDLSEAAERQVQARAEAVCADLGIEVEAKNQARVHRWYEAHFGFPYPPLRSAAEGIDRFLVRATCVGVRPGPEGWQVHAPHGLDALYAGRLEPNPLTARGTLFEDKVRSYRARWPGLSVAG